MPRLIVINKMGSDQRFEISATKMVIGRGDDAQLILPNVSVSRHHAQITVSGDVVCIKDLESRNKTIVNGKVVDEVILNSGDEVAVGKYQLIYLGDEKDDRFYRGRFVEYLPEYLARSEPMDESTFAMSPDALRRMQADMTLIREAKVTLITNPNKFWHPEDRSLTFGGGGMIPVEGMFTSGVVAELVWKGSRHVLVRHARLAKVLVNDEAVNEQPLRNGDRIRIANTGFRYDTEAK